MDQARPITDVHVENGRVHDARPKRSRWCGTERAPSFIEKEAKLMRFAKAICCAAALTACLAPGVRADEFNKKTILTFSGPVQIPGATLAAGTYVFKLADLSSNRHVVQVFDKDEKKIYATLLAIPDQKLDPSDEPVVLFAERPAGSPQAVKAWFYPGETIGNEFVYPKNQAMKIARESHTSVLSMDETPATTTDEERRESMKSASITRIDESGAAAQQTTTAAAATKSSTTTTETATTTTAGAATTTAAAAPAPAPVTSPEVTPEPQATTTASADARLKNSAGNVPVATAEQPAGTSGQADRPARLPRTASNMALFELFSALTIAGGFGLRHLRARLAQ